MLKTLVINVENMVTCLLAYISSTVRCQCAKSDVYAWTGLKQDLKSGYLT